MFQYLFSFRWSMESKVAGWPHGGILLPNDLLSTGGDIQCQFNSSAYCPENITSFWNIRRTRTRHTIYNTASCKFSASNSIQGIFFGKLGFQTFREAGDWLCFWKVSRGNVWDGEPVPAAHCGTDSNSINTWKNKRIKKTQLQYWPSGGL